MVSLPLLTGPVTSSRVFVGVTAQPSPEGLVFQLPPTPAGRRLLRSDGSS